MAPCTGPAFLIATMMISPVNLQDERDTQASSSQAKVLSSPSRYPRSAKQAAQKSLTLVLRGIHKVSFTALNAVNVWTGATCNEADQDKIAIPAHKATRGMPSAAYGLCHACYESHFRRVPKQTASPLHSPANAFKAHHMVGIWLLIDIPIMSARFAGNEVILLLTDGTHV